MKVLITGHHGYIGSVMTGLICGAGHDVTGLDLYLYEGCDFGTEVQAVPSIRKDIRDVTPEDLRGFDAVIHLAALSNDPLGCIDESCTYDINHHGSVAIARAAKVSRRDTVPLRVVMQSVRSRRQCDARRGRCIQSDLCTGRQRSSSRPMSPRWPTVTSVRPFCATRQCTASPRGFGPTSS